MTQDTLEFWQQAPCDDRARPVDGGQLVAVASFDLGNKDGVHLIDLMPRDEDALGAWTLWERLAARDPAFGRPAAFCGHIDQTRWETFTVTHSDDRFARKMKGFSGSPPGHGGLVTLKNSSRLLTFHLLQPPAYAGQPPGIHVGWGDGLFADRVGNYMKKTMCECTGEEILVEVFSHRGWQDEMPALHKGARCIPCLPP